MALLEVSNMSVSLPRDNKMVSVLERISFNLEQGLIYDLVGPSGSGKSTVLRALARLVSLDEGKMVLKGTPHTSIPPAEWRRRVCLVPQRPSLVAGSVKDNLLLPWRMKIRSGMKEPSIEILRSYLDDLLLSDVELDRDVSRLSGGQAARIALLRAFATDAEVFLLDEVDAALDAQSARAVGELAARLVKEGRTCLRVRHREPDGFAHMRFELVDGALKVADMQSGRGKSTLVRDAGSGKREEVMSCKVE